MGARPRPALDLRDQGSQVGLRGPTEGMFGHIREGHGNSPSRSLAVSSNGRAANEDSGDIVAHRSPVCACGNAIDNCCARDSFVRATRGWRRGGRGVTHVRFADRGCRRVGRRSGRRPGTTRLETRWAGMGYRRARRESDCLTCRPCSAWRDFGSSSSAMNCKNHLMCMSNEAMVTQSSGSIRSSWHTQNGSPVPSCDGCAS